MNTLLIASSNRWHVEYGNKPLKFIRERADCIIGISHVHITLEQEK